MGYVRYIIICTMYCKAFNVLYNIHVDCRFNGDYTYLCLTIIKLYVLAYYSWGITINVLLYIECSRTGVRGPADILHGLG